MEGVSIRTAGNDPLRLKRERKDIDEKMWEAWGKREREMGWRRKLKKKEEKQEKRAFDDDG